MGRFSFPKPGRKKQQAPQVTVTEPMSKAHRILGSTPLNIDGPKTWDHTSSHSVSVKVAETSPSSYGDSSWQADERAGNATSEEQWGDESDGVPPRLQRNVIGSDDDDSSMLRTRQSSSTIKSWYDRSTQPLTISHQTSSSSMSKGMSKAHRMLDMDNSHNTVKPKKKPTKLDLTSLGRSRSGKTPAYEHPDSRDSDGVLRSPSIRTPGTPTSGRKHRKLQKRPTEESLRSPEITDGFRPTTSGSARAGANNSNNGLHNLYDHYEQMSLRQLMDLETHDDFVLEKENYSEAAQTIQPLQPAPREWHTQREEPESTTGPALEPILEPTLEASHLEPGFDFLQCQPPQTARTEASNKSEQASSGDYAASISSRHTRTSRASKHTDRSMQESDLQEKSVLLLSSDSEDDSYVEPPNMSPTSVSTWRPSVAEDDITPMERFSSATLSQASVLTERRVSRASKRTSFAPTGLYAQPPVHQAPLSNLDPRGSVTSFMNPFNGPLTPSRGSTMSGSSVSTATTWQTRPGYAVQGTRAVAGLPVQAPSECESEHASEPETDSSQTDTSVLQDPATTDQPTPPLSPTSVDFYMRSAHSSIDGPGSQNRIMAVSRQEEMLLAALRQKRQIMREEPIAEVVDEDEEVLPPTARRNPTKGHRSKGSGATVASEGFDFDFFPAPPKTEIRKTTQKIPEIVTPEQRESIGSNAGPYARYSSIAGPILSPSPTRPLPKKGILKNANHESAEQPGEHILLYLDRPVDPGMSLDEPEPSPDLSDFVEYDDPASDDGRRTLDSFLPVPKARRSRDLSSQRRTSSGRMQPHPSQSHGPRHDSIKTACIAEEVEDDDSDGSLLTAGEVARADSPISPDSFPAVPPTRMTLNKLARLSAVGPGTLGAGPGWWGDSD